MLPHFLFLVDKLTVTYYNISVIKEHYLEVGNMFRQDYKIIQEQAVKIQHETMEKANTAGLQWVLCLWESPCNPQIVEKRVGYFEDIVEASYMKDYLKEKYSRYSNFKFYITTSYGDIEDGGLFDDKRS